MKLKKIAALALAGVMAVSMLAGCGTNNKPTEDPNEGEGTVTTTGYSAELGDAVKLTDKQAEYISFKDNANDQAALEKAMESLSADAVKNLAGKSVPAELKADAVGASVKAMLDSFKEAIDTPENLWVNNLSMETYANSASAWVNKPGVKVGAVFCVNGDVSTEAALKAIAETVKGQIGYMPETTKGTGVLFNYDYVVSVSAATKTLQPSFTEASNSVTVIAVTVTRSVTAANA